jgi:alpha-tubulin suppressor-like RCC1 family protein
MEGLQLVSISAGSNHSTAVDHTGMVYSWGHSEYGKITISISIYFGG